MGSEVLLYLYGFLVGTSSAPTVPALPGIEDGLTVQAISVGRITALISAVPAAGWGDGVLEHNTQQVDWVAPRAERHHTVLQAAMDGAPGGVVTVPIRFGAVFRDVEGVAERIAEQREALHEAHARLADHAEWSVKVAWRPPPKDDPRLAGGSAKGTRYLMGRVRKKQDRRTSMRRAAAGAREVALALSALAADLRQLPVRQEAGPSQVMLNLALLVHHNKADSVDGLRAAVPDEVRDDPCVELRISGPLPPYSFVIPADDDL